MIGDIIVIVVCFGLILVFREIDKQNRSFEKIKKFSDKILSDFSEYFNKQSALLKNSGVELDVKQSQAVAAVKRFEETINEFERRTAQLKEKITAVSNIESRLAAYDESLASLFDMTERVEENLEKIRAHSNLVNKVSNQLDAHEKKIGKIEHDIPSIIANLEKLNEEKMHVLGSDFSSWVEQRTADLQTLANAAVEKNEMLLDEIKQVYSQSFTEASRKAENFEDEIFTNLKERTIQRSEEFEELLTRNTNDLNEYIARERTELESSLNEKIADAQHLSDVSHEQFKQRAEAAFAQLNDMIERIDETLVIKQEESKESLKQFEANIENLLTKDRDAVLQENNDKLVSFFESIENNMLDTKADMEERLERLNASLNDIDAFESDIKNSVQAIETDVYNQLSTLQDEFTSKIETAQDEVIKANNEKTTEFFLGLDAHIKEARKDTEYRLERLNVIGQDIDGLEGNLRKLMEVAEQRVNADFEKFKEDTTIAQQGYEEQANESFNVLKEGLESIDNELNNLKTSAYENVSEKLQIFEDDFFANLSKRSEAMSEAVNDWHTEFEGQLHVLNANVEKNRLATESKFAEDMKEHISATQERYREQLLRLEENMKNTEGEYADRMQQIEKNLHSFIDVQRTEFTNAKTEAEDYFKAELENYGEITSEKIKRFERDVTNQLGQIEQSVSSSQDETTSSLESLLSDLTSWRERLNTQFQENRDLYSEKFESLQQSAQEQISQMEHIFTGEVGNYINLAREERDRLNTDIDELKVQTQNSLEMYESRSEEMLEEFRKSYEFMLEDTQKRIRGENSESEQKVRVLKSMVQEVRQESEEMQEKMVLKIQTEANILKMSMDDIDKRLKQFVAQTQLFEKTEEMKNELENQMSDLRTQLVRFENFKQVTDSIEAQFTKIRKLDDETITRMQRLSAEKNRIDALETDFSKLIALSGSMDQKITELKSTSDDLQILQVEVRRFQETLGDISSRYDRLEKKNPVLDQTMEEIDKAFQNLRELEDRLAACAQETMEIPGTVARIKSDIAGLLENAQSITDITDKLSDLDTVLATTSKQVEDVERARDGIVKVETRLTDMIKEAREQVNLYKAVKEGGKKSDPGAPPIAVRENVIKLAHQGWKPEQIAQSLNLPRGEVELILDFYGSQSR